MHIATLLPQILMSRRRNHAIVSSHGPGIFQIVWSGAEQDDQNKIRLDMPLTINGAAAGINLMCFLTCTCFQFHFDSRLECVSLQPVFAPLQP